MSRFARITAGTAALALLFSVPATVLARGATSSSCPTTKAHSLPKGAGSATFVSFGSKGGNLVPFTIQLHLDGSINASGRTSAYTQLSDPQNVMKGLLALADAEKFFSTKKAIGCLSGGGFNPDVGYRFISIHTSSGTKRVNSFGSCAATANFDQLYAVIQGAAGQGG